jgi:hypothetical protein
VQGYGVELAPLVNVWFEIAGGLPRRIALRDGQVIA